MYSSVVTALSLVSILLTRLFQTPQVSLSSVVFCLTTNYAALIPGKLQLQYQYLMDMQKWDELVCFALSISRERHFSIYTQQQTGLPFCTDCTGHVPQCCNESDPSGVYVCMHVCFSVYGISTFMLTTGIHYSRARLNVQLWCTFFGYFSFYSIYIFADYVCYGFAYIGPFLHCWIGDMGQLCTMGNSRGSHTTSAYLAESCYLVQK